MAPISRPLGLLTIITTTTSSSATLSACDSSSPIFCQPSVVYNDGRNRQQQQQQQRGGIALCTAAKNTVCRFTYKTQNETTLCQAVLQLRGFPRYSAESLDGRENELSLSPATEADSISKMVLKLQCYSCDYNSVQDTKRDPEGAMLEICKEIHQNTYKNHVLHIVELSRDEVEMMVVSKHPKFRRWQQHNNDNDDDNQHHHRSAIFEIMADLQKMERSELEGLWTEYGTKE
jgi:hypothetical protein